MNQVNLCRLTVAASPDGTRQAIDAFGRFGSERRIPDDLRRRFQVGLDEVLSNVARHGRPPDGQVNVGFAMTGDTVTVTVEDSAPAFNPLEAAPPDVSSPLELRNAGGVGIEVVRHLLEEVRYERVRGHNRLTMVDRVSRIPQQP